MEKQYRVGNLIYRNGELDVVTGIWHEMSNTVGEYDYYIQAGNRLDYSIDKVKPIPLTKQWLEGFGFERGFGEWNKGWFCLVELRGMFKVRSNDGNINVIKVTYVHELQNLYYVLTGNELTAKM